MASYGQDVPVTSINALLRTIKLDEQVRQWFVYLLRQQSMEQDLSREKGVEVSYRRLRRVLVLDKMILTFISGTVLCIMLTQQFLGGYALVIFFGAGIFLKKKRNGYLEKICGVLIGRDFERETFGRKTLYQIGEFYGRKYNIMPLVQALTSVNAVTRKAILYMLIFATFIYPLDFWRICTIVFLGYYVFSGAVSPALVYRRIK